MKVIDTHSAKQLFIDYCKAYKARDIDLILTMFTKNARGWGTAKDEIITSRDEYAAHYKRDWSQSEAGEIQIISFFESPIDANWIAATCRALITIDGVQHVFDDLRCTIVTEMEHGMLKIAYSHASFPDFRNSTGDSFPTAG